MALPCPKPHNTTSASIASALRTLATERDGLAVLMDAIGNGLVGSGRPVSGGCTSCTRFGETTGVWVFARTGAAVGERLRCARVRRAEG